MIGSAVMIGSLVFTSLTASQKRLFDIFHSYVLIVKGGPIADIRQAGGNKLINPPSQFHPVASPVKGDAGMKPG